MGVTVHKQEFHVTALGPDGTVRLMLPAWAEILSVQEQYKGTGMLSVWYRCTQDFSANVQRELIVVGTGHLAPAKAHARYISTVLLHDGHLVLHVFEGK